MNEVEDMLKKKKREFDKLEVPLELETRLKNALKEQPLPARKIGKWRIKAAALLIAAILAVYNIDTLAFYSRKLIGYDGVMNGTLKQLNELGKGQVIGKSYTFKNGVVITLDGVMLDDNQLLAFYTIKAPKGNVDEVNVVSMTMEGISGRHNEKSGMGEINKAKNEIKWIMSFENPYFFEKKLKYSFSLLEGGTSETGEIAFTLDRNKAMGHTLKMRLNEVVKVDETNIHFDSILASPTSTNIKGSIQNIAELAMDQISGERFRPQELDIRLIANGKEVPNEGGGMSTNKDGMKFNKIYDTLPENIEKLQIKLVSFCADHDVKEQVKLEKSKNKISLKVLGQDVEINNVYESKGETYVTITTEEDVILSRVYLMADGKKINLEETIPDKQDKSKDGVITSTRTLRFKGTGEDLQFQIKRIKYSKVYNQIIDIPVD